LKAGMNRQDQVGSFVWLLMGLFIIIASLSLLKVGTVLEPGPGLFPLITGGLLSLLSLITLSKAFLKQSAENRCLRELWAGLNWSRSFLTLGALSVYVIVLNIIGFILTTLLLLFFLFRVMEPQRWKLVIGLSVLGSFGSYFLFERLLQIPFPKGIFGF